MWKFSEEGRRLAKAPCPMGGKHEADPARAREDTFGCRKCGVIPKDSEEYREMMEAPDARDPFPDRL